MNLTLLLHGLLPAALGAALAPASPSAAAPPPRAACEITGATGVYADVSRATGACESARRRFSDLFGEPVPEVSVILQEESGYRTGVRGTRAVIYWPTQATLQGQAGGDPSGPFEADPWREVLPHEIAHVLLAARFFGLGDVADPGGYGTPFPDWLDEAVAIWVEPEASKRDRLVEARRLPEARRALQGIVGGRHPATTNPAVMAMRDGAPAPEDEDLYAFYPQSIALLTFIIESGGRSAALVLVERLRADPAAGLGALLGLPGLPTDAGTLESTWLRWLGSGG